MNEEGTPTFGSLFSGIGGIDLGLEWAGWKCKWQVENDPYCIRILERHWPNVRRYGDIRTVHAPPFVDLICGGFPCQPVSEAGKRKAQADERWLWPEFANIVREIRPRTILVENVPGLLTVNQGTAMGDILGDLAELGYDTRWESISAAAFGAPHLRRRVFIVAYSTSNGCDSNRIAQRSETDTYHEKRESTEIIARWEDIEPYSGKSSRWATKPRMGRVANGIPHRVDRIRTLGNAVVPQIAEYIGRQIRKREGGMDVISYISTQKLGDPMNDEPPPRKKHQVTAVYNDEEYAKIKAYADRIGISVYGLVKSALKTLMENNP